jgi:hypothetical protein
MVVIGKMTLHPGRAMRISPGNCRSALSGVFIPTRARAAILRQNSTYGHQNSNQYCLGTSHPTDHIARKSKIGHGSL